MDFLLVTGLIPRKDTSVCERGTTKLVVYLDLPVSVIALLALTGDLLAGCYLSAGFRLKCIIYWRRYELSHSLVKRHIRHLCIIRKRYDGL